MVNHLNLPVFLAVFPVFGSLITLKTRNMILTGTKTLKKPFIWKKLLWWLLEQDFLQFLDIWTQVQNQPGSYFFGIIFVIVIIWESAWWLFCMHLLQTNVPKKLLVIILAENIERYSSINSGDERCLQKSLESPSQ